MKTNRIFPVSLWLAVSLAACQSQPEYCTVKGTVDGLEDGMKLVLLDEYDQFKEVGTTRVRDGAYEFHPRISSPTHVYMYSGDDRQLKDFFLEPGTIVANVDAAEEEDFAACAAGTPSNDLLSKFSQLDKRGEKEACSALLNEVLDAEETGIVALFFVDNLTSATRGLGVLDRLSPEIAAKPFVAALREELSRRAKTEPVPEGGEGVNRYIDMEYPDADGNLVSLSSVVDDPANRLVILDFWATWCSPCRASIPALKALYAGYHEKGLEIYSVSEDPNEDNWKAFVAENGMTWVNVRDIAPGRKNSKVWSEYALRGIPTMLLIDGETGEILLRDGLQELEAKVSSLLQ